MAKLSVSLNFIPTVVSATEYMGISKMYFPKWEGWTYVERNTTVPKSIVQDFYNIYFWGRLNGDAIECQHIANLLFTFSILAGKRKAVAKLKRVLNVDASVSEYNTIEILNSCTDKDYVFLYLYAEMLELLISNKVNPYVLIQCYYSWLNKSKALTS